EDLPLVLRISRLILSFCGWSTGCLSPAVRALLTSRSERATGFLRSIEIRSGIVGSYSPCFLSSVELPAPQEGDIQVETPSLGNIHLLRTNQKSSAPRIRSPVCIYNSFFVNDRCENL